ncbi:MAG: SRPBCC family protein [Solirubrobacteraceae bacterium]|nr:SRPBCC family protein [Solirubrobacteraceae bacterium]
MQHLVFDQDFTLPVERIYAFLSEHENLGLVLAPMKVTRLTDGTGSRNGVGSSRRLAIGGKIGPFVETVTEAVENERIVYTVTKGSPIKNHRGVQTFTSLPGGGSHLRWEISFEGKAPLIGAVVAAGIKNSVSKGLKKVDSRA